MNEALKTIRVVRTDANFEREKLLRPFGFKGGYLTELWQTAALLASETGIQKIGLATQSVLYGDAALFAMHSEASGNALMFALTDHALQLVRQMPYKTPVGLQDSLLPEVHAAGITLTDRKELHKNFTFNSLVSVDHAAWLLYAAENGLESFDAMLPERYKAALSARNDKIAIMYQVPYGMPVQEIQQAVQQGYFVIKIKTGQPGSQEEMLEKDKARLSEIHQALAQARTDQTADGKLLYTIDANGRYERLDTLKRFLDHARKIGALDQILLVEEPLREENEEYVGDLGVRIAADESVHDEAGALKKLEQGYGALVLKGIAKTLSFSLKIARLAYERQVPCFCADLTVNPILIDWHKNLAARLSPFPGLGMGMMETNGDMNYQNWPAMLQYHPAAGASWTKMRNGVFELDKEFYQQSGGIFQPSSHYQAMFQMNEG